jgi:hypothetical protein
MLGWESIVGIGAPLAIGVQRQVLASVVATTRSTAFPARRLESKDSADPASVARILESSRKIILAR